MLIGFLILPATLRSLYGCEGGGAGRVPRCPAGRRREVVGEEDDRGRLGQIPAPWGKPETIKIVSA